MYFIILFINNKMSETVSTATKTIDTKLTSDVSFFATTPNEIMSWMSFNLKIIFAICLFCLISSIIMSLVNIFKGVPDENDSIIFVPPQMRNMECPCKGNCPCLGHNCPCNICRRLRQRQYNLTEEFGNTEEFSNDEMYSYKSTQHSDYQSIPLLAQYDKFNNPENLLFGQANRHIYAKNDVTIFNLEVYCNLFVLEGNIYDKTPRHTTKQEYRVYLLNDKDKIKIFLDKLQKDGDGVYKLKFKTDKVTDFIKYNKIVIAYALDNNEQILLQGQFK